MDRSPYGALSILLLESIVKNLNVIIVGQEIRGTAQSEGSFNMWRTDYQDTDDLANWILTQSWCNGRIDTFGASADGFSAFTAWISRPSYVQAQYFIWTTADVYPIFFPNGAYASNLVYQWLHNTIPEQAARVVAELERNEVRSSW
jgi:predicted acyl esterase